MTTVYKHDTERRVVFEGDPSAGFNYGFDYDLRLTNSTLRNGASFIYGQFDPRNMPRSITLPGGGSETLAYDLLKRLLQRKISSCPPPGRRTSPTTPRAVKGSKPTSRMAGTGTRLPTTTMKPARSWPPITMRTAPPLASPIPITPTPAGNRSFTHPVLP